MNVVWMGEMDGRRVVWVVEMDGQMVWIGEMQLGLCITTMCGDTVQASAHLGLSGGTTHVCLPALTR